MTKRQLVQILEYSWYSAVRGKLSGTKTEYYQGQIDLLNDLYGCFGCPMKNAADEKTVRFRTPVSTADALLSGEWNRIV